MLGRVLNNVKKASGQDWFISLTNMTLFTVFSKFWNGVSASSRIEQLTPINFEHFRSQTCSGDASYGSWLHSCERPPLDAEYGLG